MQMNLGAGQVGPSGNPAVSIAHEDIGYLQEALSRLELLSIELQKKLLECDSFQPAWIDVRLMAKFSSEWRRIDDTITRNANETTTDAMLGALSEMIQQHDEGNDSDFN